MTVVSVVLLALAVLWSFVDARLIDGVPVWTKPLKFALSFVFLFGTLALLEPRLSRHVRDGWPLRIVGWVMAAAFLSEMAYMMVQAGRAEPSHFNMSTPFHAFMYTVVMAAGAVALVTATGIVGWIAKRDAGADLSPALREAIRRGFALTFGLTMIVAGYMSAGSGHLVGTHPYGAPRLPLFGWSRVTGDLRPAHFASIHAMQVLPLLALWLDRGGRAGSVRTVRMAAAFLCNDHACRVRTGASGTAPDPAGLRGSGWRAKSQAVCSRANAGPAWPDDGTVPAKTVLTGGLRGARLPGPLPVRTSGRSPMPEIERLTGFIGAEMSGVDLRALDDPDLRAALRRALAAHHVLVFRGQHLTVSEQKAVTEVFGCLMSLPYVAPIPEDASVIAVLKEAHETAGGVFGGEWHSDFSFLENPPAGSVLSAVEIPAVGGDTVWASQAAALDSLPAHLAKFLKGRMAVHVGKPYGVRHAPPEKDRAGGSIRMSRGDPEADREIRHPAIVTDPESGRQALFLNPIYTTRFDDMTEEESRPFLEQIYRHAVRPDFSMRHRWRPGDVLVWDNRMTLHYATNDYAGARRLLYRTTFRRDPQRGV